MTISAQTAVAISLASAICFSVTACGADPNPEEVLANMRTAYTNLTSYSDSGAVKTTISMGGHKQILNKPFAITFKKPNLIKVEWTSSFGGMKDPHVLWSNKAGTFTHNKILNQTRKHESLENAIRSWTGVSGGSVHNVPCMLIDVMKAPQFCDIADLKTQEVESVGDTKCQKVSGTRRGQPITLWIGEEDFLLRKLAISTQFGDIVETHENIKTNVEMEDDSASFVPPEAAEQVERFSYKKLKK